MWPFPTFRWPWKSTVLPTLHARRVSGGKLRGAPAQWAFTDGMQIGCHYSCTGSPLGHAILKHRLLRAKGWRVVSLSHTTLDQCGGHQDIAAVLRPSLAAAFQENGISF